MGYYTKFDLKVEPSDLLDNKNKLKEFKENFNKVCSGNEYDFVFYDECKWYTHEEDMLKISKLYSEHLFMLTGEGEDHSDIWRQYFFNGKSQLCRSIITFEDFDESKLR